MARKRTRSSSGLRSSTASYRTRSLNSSHDSSRLMYGICASDRRCRAPERGSADSRSRERDVLTRERCRGRTAAETYLLAVRAYPSLWRCPSCVATFALPPRLVVRGRDTPRAGARTCRSPCGGRRPRSAAARTAHQLMSVSWVWAGDQRRVGVEPAGHAGLAAAEGARAQPAQRREVVAREVAVGPFDLERRVGPVGVDAPRHEVLAGLHKGAHDRSMAEVGLYAVRRMTNTTADLDRLPFMPRTPRPEDLYDLRVPVEVALSPDGTRVAFTVKAANPRRDGYRTALWIVPADGSAPARQLTLGINSDSSPRWSPDGQSLAFLSDREIGPDEGRRRRRSGPPRADQGRRRPGLAAAHGRRRGASADEAAAERDRHALEPRRRAARPRIWLAHSANATQSAIQSCRPRSTPS